MRKTILTGICFLLTLINEAKAELSPFQGLLLSYPIATLESLLVEAEGANLRDASCQAQLASLSRELYALSLKELPRKELFDFAKSSSDSHPEVWMPKAIDLLWKTQLALRKRIQVMLKENPEVAAAWSRPTRSNRPSFLMKKMPGVNDEAPTLKFSDVERAGVRRVREAERVLRHMRDYLSYLLWSHSREKSDEPVIFPGDLPESSKFSLNASDFQTGDGMDTRGDAGISALIGRLAFLDEASLADQNIEDAQFSHALLVGPEHKGQRMTTEALIETDVRNPPLQEILDRRSARSALLRHEDSQLAEVSGKLMHAYADYCIREGRPIPYDFNGLGPGLNCSGVVKYGYQYGARELRWIPRELPVLPWFDIQFSAEKRKVLDQLGFEARQMFDPESLWFQPTMNVVAEWIYPEKIPVVLAKDVTMSKLLSWVELEGANASPTWREVTLASLAYVLVQVYPDLEWARKKMNPKMRLKTAIYALMWNRISDKVSSLVLQRAEAFQKEHGVPMTWADASAYLEELREYQPEVFRPWLKFR